MKTLVAVLGWALFALVLFQDRRTEAQSVAVAEARAQRFVVVDANGAKRAELGETLKFFDGSGNVTHEVGSFGIRLLTGGSFSGLSQLLDSRGSCAVTVPPIDDGSMLDLILPKRPPEKK